MLFAIETQPPKPQSFLVALTSPDDPASARTIVDPNTIDPSGATTIDFYVPSHDGKLVAVSLSKNGSEDGSLSVFDAATGKRLEDPIPRVNGATAGGGVAWNADSTGFWYTRYPRVGERTGPDINFYQQVYFHKVSGASGSGARSPESQRDEYALGRELPRIAEVTLASSDDGKFVVAMVGNGDGGDFMTYIRSATGWPLAPDRAHRRSDSVRRFRPGQFAVRLVAFGRAHGQDPATIRARVSIRSSGHGEDGGDAGPFGI